MLRFTILKTVGEDEKVVLEYDENQILARLQARVRENLVEKENIITHRFKKDEVVIIHEFTKKEMENALNKAFKDLAVEFKEKTVSLT